MKALLQFGLRSILVAIGAIIFGVLADMIWGRPAGSYALVAAIVGALLAAVLFSTKLLHTPFLKRISRLWLWPAVAGLVLGFIVFTELQGRIGSYTGADEGFISFVDIVNAR